MAKRKWACRGRLRSPGPFLLCLAGWLGRLEGHRWPLEPGGDGSDMLSSLQVGGLEAITILPAGGAGGRTGLPGDYLYGDHREPYRQAGLWGLFRVVAAEEAGGLRPLPGR